MAEATATIVEASRTFSTDKAVKDRQEKRVAEEDAIKARGGN